ncbi:small-conductance mechanosensitive channel [Herbaspirillum sp. CF444]|uniref:mechanosensitive ion channel family protein n=1 Tax=Herbaspirillum sp. CF444 TaxID=1144319 RepID=UPI0002726E32|nr:mechanosensitive ion channel domain-containing protein [Herbaspirillum sp. CF444]EJL92877.1 small-conductance mechanosensitive channel [Herbaspirillum sp. CF444]
MSTLLSDFYEYLFGDLAPLELARQFIVILLCVLAGLGLSRWVRKLFTLSGSEDSVVNIGVKSFVRVLSPLLILILLALARLVLIRLKLPVTLWQVMLPLMISQVAMRFVFYVLRRIFIKDATAGAFLQLFEKVFAALVWICVLLYITGLWPELVDYLDETMLPLGRHKTSLLTILQATASVLVTLIIAMWAGAMLEDRLMKLNTMHSSLRTVVARLVRAILILVAILVSLSLVGIDLTVLSVFGGALGVGLGLGLQKIASSYVSGFVILLERSLAIGDMVNVDRYFGKVTQINTRYTILEGLDGIESVLPNEMFMSSPVQNYSLNRKIIRLATQVTILYQDDIETVLSMLEQATIAVERVSDQILPQALLLKIGEDGLQLEIGFWITDPENGRLNVLSDVNRAIWRVFKTQGIQVAHPKRDIRVMDQRSFEQSIVSQASSAHKDA